MWRRLFAEDIDELIRDDRVDDDHHQPAGIRSGRCVRHKYVKAAVVQRSLSGLRGLRDVFSRMDV